MGYVLKVYNMSIREMFNKSILDTNLANSISPPGLTHIGNGLDRAVFRIDVGKYEGKILKIARENKELHLMQNRNEIRTWKTVENTEFEKYFCPVIPEDSDLQSYKYLIMKEANTNSTISRREKETIIKKLKNNSIPVTDASKGNFGYYNRNIVFIDYPWGKFRI